MSQTVVLNDNVTFTVVATSSTALSYQWRKNGVNINKATQSTYTIAPVSPIDASNYSVKVTNGGGSVTSSNATLTVLTPPRITTQPQSQTATQGLSAAFSVVASGTPPFSFQWKYLGADLPGATEATLVLNNVQLVQAGNYSVAVKNPWGTAVSTQAFLKAIPPPGSDQPLMKDLVAHLAFDGDLADASGRGNHAAAVGAPNIVPGFIGAGSFNPFTQNGTNNYATFGTPVDLSFDKYTDFTIAFWARLPMGAWSGYYADPAFISNKDWSSYYNDGWVLATGADGRLQWNYAEASKPRKDYSGPAESFGNRIWHHVAVTFERNGNAITYFDGVPVSTNSIAPGDKSIDSGLPTNIGNDGTGNYPASYGYWTNAFGIPANGLAMDNLGIWRRVLLPLEIGAIYNVGLAGGDLASIASVDFTLVTPPRITQEPVNRQVIAGSSVTFAVTASGSAPLRYQWFDDGFSLAGQTNASLTLSNVQPAQAGSYWVVITNSAGSVTSAMAKLNLIAVPPGSYLEGVMMDSPLAFWRLGELSGTTAFDCVGGYHAAYANATLNQAGALVTDSDTSAGFNGMSSYVGTSVGLANNLTAFTMEGWFKLNAGSTRMGFWGQNDAIEFGLINATNFQIWTSGGGLLDVTDIWGTNSWHHIAAVGDGTNLRLYIDGNLAGTGGVPTTNYGSSIYPFNLGGGGIFDSTGNWFNGCIDEVAFYDRALPATDIKRHHLLGLSLPTITSQPQSQSVALGQNATFSVTATGAEPLNYQWSRNGTALPGATNSTLTLNNVQASNAGDYLVTIANDDGSITSDLASLTVADPPSVPTPLLSSAGMNSDGFSFQFSAPVGCTYVILASSNSQDWTPIATNVVLTTTVVFTDAAAANYSERFYRAMVQ